MRFIGDIFFIWTHGEDCFQEFISYLNSSHRTIKFTSEYSKTALNFLGVSIKVGVGGALGRDLCCKPTDTHQYLHSKSCHPWHTKKAIPFSQALRVRRICSDDSSFQSRLGELSESFKERGNEESFVQQQISRVRVLDGEALTRDSDKQRNQEREDRVPLVTTYHPALSYMMRVVQK